MKKFRVKVGTHIQDGKAYRAGKSVLSELPLDTMFPGKFELATVPAPVLPAAPVKSPAAPLAPLPADAPEEETTKPRKRRPVE